MKVLNILHISDSHIQNNDIYTLNEIVEKLIQDVQRVQIEKELEIDLICFTGDLIQRGDKALQDENQWNLSMKILIEPIMKALKLPIDRFIIVPGNHEININKILIAVEDGLHTDSIEKISRIYDNFDVSYRNRISYFYDIVKQLHPNVKIEKLGFTYNKNINGINTGIACIDTSWRSSGKGQLEKGNLYVCIKQLKDLYLQIKDTELKICMMHHPVDWLTQGECLEVEKELAKYDIVLQGHVHNEDLKQVIRRNLKTVYSVAGKLYPLDFAEGRAIDGYNGYSIININYKEKKCNIFLRTYFANNRQEFDAALNICAAGEQCYDICSNMDVCSMKFDVIKGISNYFYDMSEKYSMIKSVDSKTPRDIRQILIEPVLAYKSEYIKEEEDDEDKELSINNIMNSTENILLIGKKESGKTTILQQIGLQYITEYEQKGLIPIHINMKYLPQGNEKLLKASIRFVQNNILDNEALSKRQIVDLMTQGKVVFLIDNVKTSNADYTLWISKFIEKFKDNRFILTIEEEFFQSLDVKHIPEYGTSFKEIYIQYMGKRQIRAIVAKWAKGRENIINIDETVDKIDLFCNQINFAKTPFNIAVFMIIWDEDNGFIPTNEGLIMENYLQIILEKFSSKEVLRKTYAFSIKKDFLSYLAHEMYIKEEYFFTKEEFENLVYRYHLKKGYNLSESRFDKLFLEKNILSYSDEYIVFSHTSFLEYFLAVFANNNYNFLNKITKKGNRINYRNVICFYSGFNQNCIELLDNLSLDIINTVIENMDIIDNLNDMQIMTEFKIDKEQLVSNIQKNRPSQEDLDIASDYSNKYIEKKPTEIGKNDIAEIEAEDFMSLLQMYGSIIKNAELMDNNYKIVHLENYMYGMNMLYAMLIKLFNYVKIEMKYEELSDNDIKQLKTDSKEEFEELKNRMVDITKLIFPIAIQNMILENVGTPKLEAAINELIERRQEKSFEKFMLIFLKCDLKMVNLKQQLSKYIKKEKSKDILKIALMKLTFYYRFRYFGINPQIDKELIDLIGQIYMIINPTRYQNLNKSKILKELKYTLDNK